MCSKFKFSKTIENWSINVQLFTNWYVSCMLIIIFLFYASIWIILNTFSINISDLNL